MRERTKSSAGFDYQVERHNTSWSDHVARTNVTAALIAWLRPSTVLDPACGDGSIVAAARHIEPIRRVVLGDISKPNIEWVSRSMDIGPADVYQLDVREMLLREESFEMIVLTEILEHLEDPDEILRLARYKASHLVASSPVMRPGQEDTNPEHLWMFDEHGYKTMLSQAGWTPAQKTILAFPALMYDFQIWVCR